MLVLEIEFPGYRCWETSQLYLETDHQCHKKPLYRYSAVFLFFTLNPVKLFLRDNQCAHTSLLQLINETPLILLLSAFFICLVCLILVCPLLFFLLSISSKWGSPSFRRGWPSQYPHPQTEDWDATGNSEASTSVRLWNIGTSSPAHHQHTHTHTHTGLIWQAWTWAGKCLFNVQACTCTSPRRGSTLGSWLRAMRERDLTYAALKLMLQECFLVTL